MPTKREREYYRMGYEDGLSSAQYSTEYRRGVLRNEYLQVDPKGKYPIREPATLKKRKLSAWNKFVKANSRKKEFRYANGKLKLKKMGIAFRRKKRR